MSRCPYPISWNIYGIFKVTIPVNYRHNFKFRVDLLSICHRQLCADDIQRQLNRRRPGQSAITTQRDEKDRVQILSGVEVLHQMFIF